jgi:hypothetical protein
MPLTTQPRRSHGTGETGQMIKQFTLNGQPIAIEFTSLNKAIKKAEAMGFTHYWDGSCLNTLDMYVMFHKRDIYLQGGSQTKYAIYEQQGRTVIGVTSNPNPNSKNFAIGSYPLVKA